MAVEGRWAPLGTGDSHLSDPEPPLLRAGKGPQLEDKLSKLGYWASLHQPQHVGVVGRVSTGAAGGEGAQRWGAWAAIQKPHLQPCLSEAGPQHFTQLAHLHLTAP